MIPVILIAIGVLAIGLGIFLISQKKPPIPDSTQTEKQIPEVSQAQFSEMKQVADFLGRKNETDLRSEFDLESMLIRNINILRIKIGFIRSGKWEEFNYGPYLEGGPKNMIYRARTGQYSVGPSGVHIDAGPHDVVLLVETAKHQDAAAKMDGFINSPLLPEDVKIALKNFSHVMGEDVELMIDILDEKMHESEEFFLQVDAIDSPYHHVIQNEYAVRFKAIKPSSDRVLNAIATHWHIDNN